ncbi:2,5-diamino-6-(ribosylamino)-4(3H)-pyrimidinone 5'-phosphate reductase [Talaromyces marneffei ATCC 18224]
MHELGKMSSYPRDTLHFPPSSRPFLDSYLPPLPDDKDTTKQDELSRPFTTLTFATSLDSSLSLAPGVRTTLSGPQSKAMTHYLRFRHEAILIGVGTAIADDPGLNCRIEGASGYEEQTSPPPDPAIQALAVEASSNLELKDLTKAVDSSQASPEQLRPFQNHIDRVQMENIRQRQASLHQPRPIIIDPNARWEPRESRKIIALVKQGKGKAPFVIISKLTSPPDEARELLEKYGGKYIALDTVTSNNPDDSVDAAHQHFDWNVILNVLATKENIKSIMIEGGGSIINSLLSEQRYSALIDSVIVTIAPTWLGQGGVVVSPQRRVDSYGCAIPASRLTDVKWHPFGEDVVLCGRIKRS